MAAIIVSDDFGDTAHPGNLPGTAISPAIPFLIPSDGTVFNGSVTVPNDPTFGRVLRLDDGDTAAGTTTAAVGELPGTAFLTTAGDTVNISFKFRFTSTSAANTFRFGLFNSMGTSAAGTGSHNDIGYYINMPEVGATASNVFFRENSGTTPAMGGGDRTNYASNAALAALGTLGASDLYSVTLSLTRTATNINFSLGIAAGAGPTSTYTATTNSSLISSFDEIMFNTAFNSTTSGGTDLIIDDLVIDASNFTPIPEPSSAMLAALTGAGLLFRRRK